MPDAASWKRFLLDEDPQLRDSVGFYLYESWPSDRDLVPLVLASCRRYGVRKSLRLLTFAERFPIGPHGLLESLRVLSTSPVPFVEQWVSKAPLRLLAGPADVVRTVLSPYALSRLDRRLTLAKSTVPELWQRLADLSRMLDEDRAEPSAREEVEDVVEALAEVELHESLLKKIALLSTLQSPNFRRALVALAGAAGLDSRLCCLVESLDDEDACLGAEVVRSLARTPSHAAVQAISTHYPRRGRRFRQRALRTLRAIKCESSEALLTSLLERERDPGLRAGIFDALRFHFTETAENILRGELDHSTSTMNALEIRRALGVLSRLREGLGQDMDRPWDERRFGESTAETFTRA